MSDFTLAIGKILANEGDAIVHDDNGRGVSKYGITFETYRQHHPGATSWDILNMTPEKAAEFYGSDYGWFPLHFDLIDSQAVAEKVFDTGLPMGPQTAIKLLQQAVDAVPDGIIGPQTAAAVNSKPASDVVAAFRLLAQEHYAAVLWSDQAKYGIQYAGWIARLYKD